ncbi:MAG TPA: GNAT family N-acetyltransferase [Saprospiraceae bacterium]|nr:GNAT family N-acetyltransferase [Saprospiraceae bacterium]
METDLEKYEVVNNTKDHRFEIDLDGKFAIVPYDIKDDIIGLFHTEVPEEYGGKGLGTKLALYALNYAKDHNLKILPYCPFIAKYIKEHPQWTQYVKHFPNVK